jgi:hypothetical protein
MPMRLFAKRFYGFDPIRWPIVAFGKASNCEALIHASEPGDCLVFVGTRSEPTVIGERGKLLGIAEFARTPIDVSDVLDDGDELPFERQADGALMWSAALPIVRAWGYRKPLLNLTDVLYEQLTYEATGRAVLLSKSDTAAVLAIPRVEISVPQLRMRITSPNAATSRLIESEIPTTGPVPTNWEGAVRRSANAVSWTYVFRFGARDLWKIGHAIDVPSRLVEVNRHVPYEEIGERWAVFLKQSWPNSIEAYDMEQEMFGRLRSMRTSGERVRCADTEVISAWNACLNQSQAHG